MMPRIPPTDELMVPQNISASNQMQRAGKYYKEYENWVVISWMCEEDLLAQEEGSKLEQIAKFIWES
jgi:hypothetical protein